MKTYYNRVFNTPEKIEELIRLRESGLSYNDLGIYFHCDHTSVLYQLRKAKIKQPDIKVKTRERRISKEKCQTCEMLISSPIHQQNPCQPKN